LRPVRAGTGEGTIAKLKTLWRIFQLDAAR
jgi:hypothetical protein